MEEVLGVLMLDADNEEIEYAILDNIFIDRDELNQWGNNVFNLNELSDKYIKDHFRFERNDLRKLLKVLRLPDQIFTNTRNRVDGMTALCVVLKRLAYPNRLKDLCDMFYLSPQSLSQIFNKAIQIILQNNDKFLTNLNELLWLNGEKMAHYAEAIRNRGAAIPNCWGFIDGTARQICRPTANQEDYYSGHKRNHCVKYQSVLCPDGIIISLKGAYPGRRHDAGILRESHLVEELQTKSVINENERYVLYGDQAYGVMEFLLSPYPGRPENLPLYQQQFNRSMKTLRVSVEWGFQKVVSEFAFIDFKKNQKLLLQDVEAMYKVAVLLTNCHTCLYGSQTSMYFSMPPPTLEEYFGI